jgi:hypothetical protein
MKSLKKAVLAVSAVILTSGCVHTQSLEPQAGPVAMPAAAPETKPAMRPLQSYGSMGGYRYRRYAGAVNS